ncbi:MAG: tetratricopeptide repeat protein [Myxococcales bacterium]|nr:tetratricopeptide repeat protein [Myxococcales bacterium]
MDVRRTPPLEPRPAPLPIADRRGLPRCVGREGELVALERLHDEALATGRGRVALVTGPAGIGKSRLMQELRRRLQGRGATVVEGRSREGARAFQPLLEVVEATVRALGDLGASRTAAHGLEVCEALQGRNAARPGGGEAAASEMRRVALYERLAAFLAEAARIQPLVIVIHDLHLADAASRKLTAHLAQTRFASPELPASIEDRLRGLLVVTSRDDAGDWLEGVAAERVALCGLDDGGIREFLQSPEVVQFFAEATGGRPRALEALLEARPADADELFHALRGRLSPEAGRILRALSVYGRPASPDALYRLSGGRPGPHEPLGDEVVRAVTELVEARLLSKVVVDGELRLGFTRSADEEATYQAQGEADRRLLHAQVGRFLAERGDEADVVAAAEHLCRGGAGEVAVDAALTAGERLELTFGYDRALALYGRAHALTTRDDMREELERRSVELGRLTGDYAGALENAERLRWRAPNDASVHRRIGQLHLLRDEFALARSALGRARELADADEMARVLAAFAEVCFLDGHPAEARATCEAGLAAIPAEASAHGDGEAYRLRLEIRNTLGKVHLAEGRYADAATLFAENLAEARAHRIVYEETRALINQGIAHLRLGDDGRAAECYQAALQVADASLDHRHRAFCLQNLGVLAQSKSNYGAALRHFQDAVAAFKKIGHRGRLAWLAVNLSWLYLDLGAQEKAVATAALADRLAGGNEASAVAINRAVIAGRIARGAGDPDTARLRFEEARALARRSDNRERFAEATLYLGRLDLDSGDIAATERLLGELDHGAPAAGYSQAIRARALLLAGETSAAGSARDRLAMARRALCESTEIFHRVGDLDGEWRSHFALGQVAQAAGDPAEADRRTRLAGRIDEQLRARVPEELRAGFAADKARRALEHALAMPSSRPPSPVGPESAPPHLTLVRPGTGAAPQPSPAPSPAPPPASDRYRRILGSHPRLRQVFALMDKVAPHDSLVLIRGESGTGKELIADALHAGSTRRARPLVKINCGALVESLLLSELFGHERGAFTGAVQRKKGRFEAADGGTLFLDEIGDISQKTQVALLRVLQERVFERVGSNTPVKVDVRILCATHRDLEAMVARGEFREDLYYRLKGIQIDLPPLRERAEDIPALAEAFLERIAKERGTPVKRLAQGTVDLLCRYGWPGNVRELDNVLRSVSLFADGEVIVLRDFADYTEILREPRRVAAPGREPAPQRTPALAPPADAASDGNSGAWDRLGAEGIGLRELQEKIEIECITRALHEARGNITRAAELLKMKRPRLSQLIKEYRIAL